MSTSVNQCYDLCWLSLFSSCPLAERWQHIAIQIKPALAFLHKPGAFVHLSCCGPIVSRGKLNNAPLVSFQSLLDGYNGQAGPAGRTHTLFQAALVSRSPLGGMERFDQIVRLPLAVGCVARSHQCFGSGGKRSACEIRLAAEGMSLLTAAGTSGIEEHREEEEVEERIEGEPIIRAHRPDKWVEWHQNKSERMPSETQLTRPLASTPLQPGSSLAPTAPATGRSPLPLEPVTSLGNRPTAPKSGNVVPNVWPPMTDCFP
jgi:hypothetical protein